MKPKIATFEQSQGRLQIVCATIPYKQFGGRAVIRIDEDAYKKLTKLSNQTSMSISMLGSELIRFGIEHTDIIERAVVEEYGERKS
ncbi:MAG: hypothetical protein NC122_07405 [Faecalibacterium sp.]|nr:hypothetical protein [Ruminococcus sp.]MCM1392178.1 hypothetical protein [Ruminococcus sp.]MCM1486018.1 hypothetical protein [Faecalibacterium sp.]